MYTSLSHTIIFLISFTQCFALPATSSRDATPASSYKSAQTDSSTFASVSSSPTGTHAPNGTHSYSWHYHPTGSITVQHFSWSQAPAFTHSPYPKPPPLPPIHLSPVAISFTVLGSLTGLIILVSIARMLYSYKKTPSRDRIGALVNRYLLHREMAEMAQNPTRRTSLDRPAPPPYIAPPPSYEEQVAHERRSFNGTELSEDESIHQSE